jgi:hypothetical protein
MGWLGLMRVVSLRIGSFQGGSSFLVEGKATSSLANGRKEPSSSLFNKDRDNLAVKDQEVSAVLKEGVGAPCMDRK